MVRLCRFVGFGVVAVGVAVGLAGGGVGLAARGCAVALAGAGGLYVAVFVAAAGSAVGSVGCFRVIWHCGHLDCVVT